MMDVEISDTEPGDFGPVNGTDVEGESEDFEEDDKTDFEAEPKKDKKALLTCMDCGKQFRHRNSIVYHMLSHEGNKPFQCEVCQKSFFTACALKVISDNCINIYLFKHSNKQGNYFKKVHHEIIILLIAFIYITFIFTNKKKLVDQI